MARLPQPGSDAGKWGEILNEYLGVSHATDGTLKADTVGAAQLRPNAVTGASIVSATITSAKLADDTIEESKLSSTVRTKLNAEPTVPVTSVANKTGDVIITKSDVGLVNVDNTSDANKPISTATQTALDTKASTSHTHVISHISDSSALGRSLVTAPTQVAARTALGLGKVESWAKSSFQLPRQRFKESTTAPFIVFGSNTSSVNNNFVNGATQFNGQSSVFTYSGSLFSNASYVNSYPYKAAQHVTLSDGTKSAMSAPLRVRFMTDATAIDFCFVDQLYSQFNVIIDGEYIKRDRTAVFGNTNNIRYIKLDFGSDVVTYSKVAANFTIINSGSGYSVGDSITLNGGTSNASGSPTILKVAQIGTGGAVSSVDVIEKGAYTSQPSGTFSQASTSGSGSGFQTNATFFHPEHTTRRLRTIELVYSRPALFLGMVLNANAVAIPTPTNVAQPKLAIIGDSITNGTYLQYGASHMGASIAQKLDLWDNCIISGIGGTGWNTVSTPWSHPNRIQDFIDYDADIYLFIGSQNDTANASTQSAVTTVLSQLQNARPNAYIVGIGNIMGDSSTLANTIGAGFAAAPNQSRVRFLNNHVPFKWVPSSDQASWAATSDAAHPSQAGLDRFAEIASVHVVNAIREMTV